MSLAALDRSMRRIELTQEDDDIRSQFWGEYEDYSVGINDRNDAAIMNARTILAATGCRATRNRMMPA